MLIGLKRRPKCEERGAVAVFAALIALSLMAAGALAVDLGNGFARKRDVQAQADFAALAGAALLGNSNTKSASDPAVIEVANYLTKNLPQDDSGTAPAAITPTQLVNGSDSDGEVYFTGDIKMRVVAPPAFVKFGLAGVIGFTDMNVRADASVDIESAGGAMPFFAVEGCDYGLQTITDPPPGKSNLNLAEGSDNGNAKPTSLSPAQVAKGLTPPPPLTITGTGLDGATKVGFFLNDGTTYKSVGTTPPNVSPTSIVIPAIPADVVALEEAWYVRVYNGTKWTDVADAKPLLVGDAMAECLDPASQGNFGSLLLPRYDSNNASAGGWLPINIAEGLQDPLGLDVHTAHNSIDYKCTDGVNKAVESDTSGTPTLVPQTNCLDTDTGLTANPATAGFVTGGTNTGGGSGPKAFTGRLDKDTTDGCGTNPTDRDARYPTTIPSPTSPSGKYEVNDDLLTCFLASGVKIAEIADPSYTGPAVLNPDIFFSPRLFLQPVLGVKPGPGGSDRYSIIDFRPGFLTDQPVRAEGGDLTVTGTDPALHNGLQIASGQVTKVKVIFFDYDALPDPPDGAPTMNYIGVGPKLIRLTD